MGVGPLPVPVPEPIATCRGTNARGKSFSLRPTVALQAGLLLSMQHHGSRILLLRRREDLWHTVSLAEPAPPNADLVAATADKEARAEVRRSFIMCPSTASRVPEHAAPGQLLLLQSAVGCMVLHGSLSMQHQACCSYHLLSAAWLCIRHCGDTTGTPPSPHARKATPLGALVQAS